MRELMLMECTVCKHRNYSTDKNKRTMTDKLELKKFCRFCRRHTEHKEQKIEKKAK
jgi:large subunit ribosomal protein L33